MGETILRDLREQVDALVLHFLIVTLEDFAPPEWGEETWQKQVMSAGVVVHQQIKSGQWFQPDIKLLLEVKRRVLYFSVAGADFLLKSDLEPALASYFLVDNMECMNLEGTQYLEYVTNCWQLDLLSELRLPGVVSQQVAALEATGKSYVVSPSYRRHKKLIHALYAGEDPNVAD
jgi:hypothetical protein